jgi:hypothetical protein
MRYSLIAETPEQSEICIKKGVELAEKAYDIRNSGLAVCEAFPTFCQVNPHGRDYVVESISKHILSNQRRLNDLKLFFQNVEVTEEDIKKVAEREAGIFLEKLKIEPAHEQHVEGYRLAEKAFETYGKLEDVSFAGLFALNIDLSHLNLIEISRKELNEEIKKDPPKRRMKFACEKKIDDLREKTRQEAYETILQFYKRIRNDLDSLPNFYLDGLRTTGYSTHSPIKPKWKIDQFFEERQVYGEDDLGYPLTYIWNPFGILLVPVIPPLIATHPTERDELLSIEAGHYLMLFAYAHSEDCLKFTDRLFQCLLYTLETNANEGSIMYHKLAMQHVEKAIRGNPSKVSQLNLIYSEVNKKIEEEYKKRLLNS